MRKDLRVGLGIGGVLLAVLVVALVVHSHTRQKAQDTKVAAVDKPDAADTTPTPPDSTGVTSSDPVTPPTTPATPPPAPPAPAPADTAKPDKPDKVDPFASDWDKVLLDGSMPPTTPTVTPGEHGTERAIGNHFGPSPNSPGVTPGTIPPHGITAIDIMPRSPAPAAPGAHGRTHVVAQGETLSTIAKTTYGSQKYYLLIEKANPNIVPERLRPGTTIILPDLPASEHADRRAAHVSSAASAAAADPTKEYIVKANDSLYRISMHLYGSANKVDAIYDMNKELIGPDRGRLKLGMTLRLPLPPTSGSR